jgi:hypothetical protein
MRRTHGQAVNDEGTKARIVVDYMRQRKCTFLKKHNVRRALGMSDGAFKAALETATILDGAFGEDEGYLFYWPREDL